MLRFSFVGSHYALNIRLEIGKPLEIYEDVLFFDAFNVTMVALGMMIVVKDRRLLLARANECEAVPDSVGCLPAWSYFPYYQLAKVSVFVRFLFPKN
jgi:hypothetical protein